MSLNRWFNDTVYGMPPFLDLLTVSPDLLALGEPTHGESAFLQLRNDAFLALAEHGYRSIALESDRAAGLIADEFVQGGDVPLDQALTEGFSHGFGAAPANRDLLLRMREWNTGRPAAERLTFHGFDAPVEMESAPSPRHHLDQVCHFLDLDRSAEIDDLIGDEARWRDPAAIWEPGRSVGRSTEAQRLRVIADEMLTELYLRAPWKSAGWPAAFVHATAAVALLRYHAAAAAPLAQDERFARLAGVRDALMAENLLAIRAAEAHRGPTLVFAHNTHLQRHPSTMTLAGTEMTWAGAGAIVASLLGDRYAVIVGSLGASPALGIEPPAASTYEGRLQQETDLPRYLPASDIGAAEQRTHDYRYFPLDRATIEHADAVLHIPTGVDAAVLADRIVALPGVEQVVASEEDGSPEAAWGDRFFFVGPDRRQPFATIVERDVPGFDEASQLDRPGVFRLNLDLGRAEFERLFGFPPKAFEEHRHEFDFARLDTVSPHPGYALYGFASIVMPGPQLLPEIDRLLAIAHGRAADRDDRAARRATHPQSGA
ncbi:erythromycin esterase-like protein [Micromonospora violae]|uniref:Erythromycin esterase-like protein n=2 Tax=Micromonospora violae TaxID=1278207 RepID=A0A4Q7UGZ2_9ACTN|nr:erythromycin esterase-like protein [Micromonospora violae]